MAKIYLIQRKNSKSTKFLKTDPSKGKFLWTEDPNEAYKFDELETAEEWMEDDNVGGTEVVRRTVAIAEYGGSDDAEVEVQVKPKKTKTPSLEELAPIARGKTAKRQPVKVKDDEDSEAPAAPKKSTAKKAAPAAVKKAATPAKKAAAKTAAPAKKVAASVGETKLTAMRLPLTLVDKFAKLGDGNVSAGVRKMADEYFARKK